MVNTLRRLEFVSDMRKHNILLCPQLVRLMLWSIVNLRYHILGQFLRLHALLQLRIFTLRISINLLNFLKLELLQKSLFILQILSSLHLLIELLSFLFLEHFVFLLLRVAPLRCSQDLVMHVDTCANVAILVLGLSRFVYSLPLLQNGVIFVKSLQFLVS